MQHVYKHTLHLNGTESTERRVSELRACIHLISTVLNPFNEGSSEFSASVYWKVMYTLILKWDSLIDLWDRLYTYQLCCWLSVCMHPCMLCIYIYTHMSRLYLCIHTRVQTVCVIHTRVQTICVIHTQVQTVCVIHTCVQTDVSYTHVSRLYVHTYVSKCMHSPQWFGAALGKI